MSHPRADPAALAARWIGPLRGLRLLVVDPPGVEAARRLDPDRSGGVTWFTRHWPTYRELAEAGYISHFGAWLPPDLAPEAALVFLPRSRERTRMTLAMTAAALPEGSPLHLVGVGGSGIESSASDLEAVAELEGIRSGRHSRLLEGRTRPPPRAALDDFVERWTLELGGGRLEVTSLPGVFSHGRLDDGSRLLLQTVSALPGPLLDVGCGAGILAAWYATGRGAPCTLVDADAAAVESARRTLTANGVEGTVAPGDVWPEEGGGPWATIVSNPPFHEGKATDDRVTATLVAGAPDRLLPGGSLVLVCNRFLPVQARLDRAFGSHEVLADDGRYRVYRATRR